MASHAWAERPAVQVLLAKRAHALRSIKLRQQRIKELRATVRELDAQIAALGGTRRKGRKPRPRLPVRAHGEMQAMLFKLLREQRTVTSADLGAAMLEHFGLIKPTKAEAYAMRQRASQCVQRLARRGRIRCVGGVGKGQQFKRYSATSHNPRRS